MNDCFWYFICNGCKGIKCYNCKKYISVNSEKGKELLNQYQKDLDEILEPLSEEWRIKMDEYTTD